MNTLSNLPNSATIQIADVGGLRHSISCTFDRLTGKRLSLTSDDCVPASTPVQVEYNDALFLGEVAACSHNVNDSWHLDIKVEQVLTGLQSLMNLRTRLLGEHVPETASVFSSRR